MAKAKDTMSAGARLGAGTRRKRTSQARVDQTGVDSSVVKYHALGDIQNSTSAIGAGCYFRTYAGGISGGLNIAVGPDVCSYYSTAKFMPGTKIRWEPSVSFTTSGRVFVGFTDNPEVMKVINDLKVVFDGSPTAGNYAAYANQVKALGSTISFPVWQETDINFPLKTRKKRFDVNATIDISNVDVLDRSAQCIMYCCYEGLPTGSSVAAGSFWFHDVVSVEGLHAVAT